MFMQHIPKYISQACSLCCSATIQHPNQVKLFCLRLFQLEIQLEMVVPARNSISAKIPARNPGRPRDVMVVVVVTTLMVVMVIVVFYLTA
jgi:hypothetical protein